MKFPKPHFALKFFTLLAAVVSLLFLSGCDGDAGLGDGNSVENIEFISTPNTLRQDDCIGDRGILIGNFTDGGQGNFTLRADYESSDTTVVTVNESGLLQPQSPGTAMITATFLDFTDSYTVTVSTAAIPDNATTANQGLFFFKPDPTVAAGLVHELGVYAVLTDNTTLDISAAVELSVNGESVDNFYRIPSDATGTLDVTATLCNDDDFPDYPERSVVNTLTVAPLTGLEINPINGADIPLGVLRSFTIDGTFANGDRIDLTNQSTAFTTASDGQNSLYAIVSSIDNLFIGSIFGNQVPPAGVTQNAEASIAYADDQTATGSTTITTVDATLQSLEFLAGPSDPNAPTMLAGTLIRTQGIATFDFGTFDLSPSVAVSVTTSDQLTPEVVPFNASESFMFAAGGQSGTSTITATLTLGSNAPVASASDTATLTVIDQADATVTSVDIVAGSCEAGACQATLSFTANAVSYTQDATKSVNWISNNTDVAQVSGLLDNKGEIALGDTSGTSTITANFVSENGTVTMSTSSATINNP